MRCRRPRNLFYLVTLLIVSVVFSVWLWRLDSRPLFRAEDPIRVVFSRTDYWDIPATTNLPGKEVEECFTRTNSDAAACVWLMNVLRAGRKSEQHLCADYGELILSYKDGVSVKLTILPGHDAERYEFRKDGLYSMPRKDFFEALRALGVPEEQIPVIRLR